MVSFGYSPIIAAQAIQDNMEYGRLNGDLENMIGIVSDYIMQMPSIDEESNIVEDVKKNDHENMAMIMALKKVQFELIVSVGSNDDDEIETLDPPMVTYTLEQQVCSYIHLPYNNNNNNRHYRLLKDYD